MAKERMEILFCEYICKNCGTTIEKMHSAYIDVPHRLEVKCPECKKEKIVLLQTKRMIEDENQEEDRI